MDEVLHDIIKTKKSMKENSDEWRQMNKMTNVAIEN